MGKTYNAEVVAEMLDIGFAFDQGLKMFYNDSIGKAFTYAFVIDVGVDFVVSTLIKRLKNLAREIAE